MNMAWLIAALLALSACGAASDRKDTPASPREVARAPAPFDGRTSSSAQSGPSRPDPKSPEAAAAVVQRYYAAINARDYSTAWRQWGENGRPGQTFASFVAGFRHTRSTQVTIGPLAPGDAGAGSMFQPVAVSVDAVLADQTHQRFRGTYIIRRVNDVNGASAAQLRWHIDSAQLAPSKREIL